MAKDTFTLREGTRRLRGMRDRFIVDTPSIAYESTTEMVDRLWPIRSGQLDQSRMYNHIYRIDPKAEDQEAEREKRRDSAVLAKLALPDWGYADNGGKPVDLLMDELDHDLTLMARDGVRPYERYVDGRTDPAITFETARHNSSLLPKQREALHERGLEVDENPDQKRRGRKRVQHPTENEIIRTALFIRGREEWRLNQLFEACDAIHDLAVDLGLPDNRGDLLRYAARYRAEDLFPSRAKNAPASLQDRVALATVSADGPDENGNYTANDLIGKTATRFYSIYLRAMKAGSKNKLGASAFFNKSLILLTNN